MFPEGISANSWQCPSDTDQDPEQGIGENIANDVPEEYLWGFDSSYFFSNKRMQERKWYFEDASVHATICQEYSNICWKFDLEESKWIQKNVESPGKRVCKYLVRGCQKNLLFLPNSPREKMFRAWVNPFIKESEPRETRIGTAAVFSEKATSETWLFRTMNKKNEKKSCFQSAKEWFEKFFSGSAKPEEISPNSCLDEHLSNLEEALENDSPAPPTSEELEEFLKSMYLNKIQEAVQDHKVPFLPKIEPLMPLEIDCLSEDDKLRYHEFWSQESQNFINDRLTSEQLDCLPQDQRDEYEQRWKEFIRKMLSVPRPNLRNSEISQNKFLYALKLCRINPDVDFKAVIDGRYEKYVEPENVDEYLREFESETPSYLLSKDEADEFSRDFLKRFSQFRVETRTDEMAKALFISPQIRTQRILNQKIYTDSVWTEMLDVCKKDMQSNLYQRVRNENPPKNFSCLHDLFLLHPKPAMWPEKNETNEWMTIFNRSGCIMPDAAMGPGAPKKFSMRYLGLNITNATKFRIANLYADKGFSYEGVYRVAQCWEDPLISSKTADQIASLYPAEAKFFKKLMWEKHQHTKFYEDLAKKVFAEYECAHKSDGFWKKFFIIFGVCVASIICVALMLVTFKETCIKIALSAVRVA